MSASTNSKRERGRPKSGRVERFTIRAKPEVAESFRKQAVNSEITIPQHFEELVRERQEALAKEGGC